jgi:hypothetical protein
VWQLAVGFHPDYTSFPMTGNPTTSWDPPGDYAVLHAARIGQEFIVEANEAITTWVSHLFTSV